MIKKILRKGIKKRTLKRLKAKLYFFYKTVKKNYIPVKKCRTYFYRTRELNISTFLLNGQSYLSKNSFLELFQ